MSSIAHLLIRKVTTSRKGYTFDGEGHTDAFANIATGVPAIFGPPTGKDLKIANRLDSETIRVGLYDIGPDIKKGERR